MDSDDWGGCGCITDIDTPDPQPAKATDMQPAPARNLIYMPLEELAPATKNPKRHRLDLLRSSMDRFGFASPVLRDERTGRLVVGHGRVETLTQMRDAGQSPPDGVHLDAYGRWLVPVVRGWSSRSDAEADAYLLADNRHSELGGWDSAGLADVLTELAGSDFDLAELAGWVPSELEDLLAAADMQPVQSDAVPATNAAYAETDEQLAARTERIAAYEPRVGPTTGGFTEMILVYSEADRSEATALMAAARAALSDADLRASEVMLRGLRTMGAVLHAAPNDPAAADLAKYAGWVADS